MSNKSPNLPPLLSSASAASAWGLLVFDDDVSGVVDSGDDSRTVIAASISSQYIDQHFDGEDVSDQVGDGLARLS